MTKLTITGNTRPVVGNTEVYSLLVLDHAMTSGPFSVPQPEIRWNIYVQDRKGWRIANGNGKEGERVTYKFTNKSLRYKALKIEAVRGKDRGELYIKPGEAEESKILSVELLDINSAKLSRGKPLHYTDTIVAKAYCVGMLGYKVSFILWEDDAVGKGHDPVINRMNRINLVPLVAEVDDEGVARGVFRLPVYTMAARIANMGIAEGDRDEGRTHEYYVTAEVISKHISKTSPNVNVVNPAYIPPSGEKPGSKENTPSTGNLPAIPGKHGAKYNRPKPEDQTAKFPQTSAAKNQADPNGKILNAEFTDSTGKPLKNALTGDVVSIRITSRNMKGQNVKVRIWEEDLSRYSNDLLYEKSVMLAYPATNFINGISLTKEMYAQSSDWGEGKDREYFIEVEHLNTSVTSRVIRVSPDAEPVKAEANDSVAVIKENKRDLKNCGGTYCIDKNSPPGELIREINIRLAGFGGNVPTDQFTDRTEKMIKQFQRDYMKVPETGRVCGNVLKAIDEFQQKYIIDFDDVKCSCGKCKGFGNDKFPEQKQNSKIAELKRKYEYPGIHRSLIWALRAAMFYTTVIEKNMKYSVKCIFSGYRCWVDNDIHNRSSTNHMGKALDLHFNKNGKRTQILKEVEEIRQKIFVKYLGNQVRWNETNKFSLEPGVAAYKGEFIASTWIHYDVRQFELKYLADQYFAKNINQVNGESIITMASKIYPNICSCMGEGEVKQIHSSAVVPKKQNNGFTIKDAEAALKIINARYGKEMAQTIEMIYRWETGHFKSGQYVNCGSPGMEAFGEAPSYGWNSEIYTEYPEYIPVGLWERYENKGKSGQGGNKQITDRAKKYIMFPSVEAGMSYIAEFILRYNGNVGRWHSKDLTIQKNYIKDINTTIPKISNNF